MDEPPLFIQILLKADAFPLWPLTGLNPIGNILFIPSCHNMYSKGFGNDRPPCPTLGMQHIGEGKIYGISFNGGNKKLDSGTGPANREGKLIFHL